MISFQERHAGRKNRWIARWGGFSSLGYRSSKLGKAVDAVGLLERPETCPTPRTWIWPYVLGFGFGLPPGGGREGVTGIERFAKESNQRRKSHHLAGEHALLQLNEFEPARKILDQRLASTPKLPRL